MLSAIQATATVKGLYSPLEHPEGNVSYYKYRLINPLRKLPNKTSRTEQLKKEKTYVRPRSIDRKFLFLDCELQQQQNWFIHKLFIN